MMLIISPDKMNLFWFQQLADGADAPPRVANIMHMLQPDLLIG